MQEHSSKNEMLSWERICFYYKKYWYIVIIFGVIAILALCFRISGNINIKETEDEKKIILHETYILEKRMENIVSTSGVLADAKVFLNTDSMISYVNAYLEDHKAERISDLSMVTADMIEQSNCISVSIQGDTQHQVEILEEAVRTFWTEKLNEIYGEMEFVVLDEKIKEGVEEFEDNQSMVINLSDLIIFGIVFFLGIGIVYFFMILDDRIVTKNELIYVLKCENVFDVMDEQMFEIWMEHQGDYHDKVKIICGNNLESYVKLLQEKMWEIEKLDMLFQKDESCTQYLLVKKGHVREKELKRFCEKMSLTEQVLKGALFVN